MTREMKYSGVEWIGNIPSEWKVENLQWNLTEIIEKNSYIKMKSVLSLTKEKGVIPYEDKGNQGNKSKESIEEYKIAYKDTIVANSMNILIGSVGISNYDGCVSPVYYVFKNNKNTDLRYLNYIFSTEQFQKQLRKYANGILEIRLRVSSENILKQKVMIPPLLEQKKIADFLDNKVSEIDKIIAETKSSIENYKEYKQSVITEAVTKGLDKNVQMKDSGIEYISKIPFHWEMEKGKRILSLLSRPVKEDDDVITCFRDGEVTLRKKRREEGFTFSLKEIGYQGIEIGDLVVHGMDGFAGAIGISVARGKASPVLNVLDTNCNKRYIMYYLRSLAFNNIFTALATGIRVRSCDLRWNKLADLMYIIPPINEQEKIANYIDEKCIQIDKIISEKEELILDLEEYKKSLIYEYVTGKRTVE